jgi:hypothetical protein
MKYKKILLVLGMSLIGIGIKLGQLLFSAYFQNSYVNLGFFPNILDSIIIGIGGIALIITYFKTK